MSPGFQLFSPTPNTFLCPILILRLNTALFSLSWRFCFYQFRLCWQWGLSSEEQKPMVLSQTHRSVVLLGWRCSLGLEWVNVGGETHEEWQALTTVTGSHLLALQIQISNCPSQEMLRWLGNILNKTLQFANSFASFCPIYFTERYRFGRKIKRTKVWMTPGRRTKHLKE